MQLALHDLAGRAHQCGLLHHRTVTLAHHLHIDVDLALRMHHGQQVTPSGPGHARSHRPRQRKGGAHTDGPGHCMRGVATVGCEVAGNDAVRGVARTDDDRLGHDAARDIAQAHAPASLQAHGLDLLEQVGIRIELRRTLAARQTQIGCTHHHQRHGGIDAGDGHPLDALGTLARRKQMPRDGTPGIQKIQQDRGGCPGHTVDARLAFVADPTARCLHGGLDLGPGVDVVDAHRGGPVLRLDQALLDGKGRHTREHVAAVGAGIDRLVPHADLGKEVIEIAVGQGRARNDGHLAVEGAVAAQPVELQRIGRADRTDQGLVTDRRVLGQPVLEEKRAA